jgi:hypothetical protein
MPDDPLAKAYAESNPDGYDWTVFEERQIRGLPAVVRSLSTSDDECEMIVGTGNGAKAPRSSRPPGSATPECAIGS